MHDHVTLLNFLITKYGYTKYLEIGCAADECFGEIKITDKVGVDPASGGTVRLPSDEYFATLSPEVKFDLVFIDGLHFSEQVDRDISNSLKHLNVGGTIVLHDCKPTTEAIATYPCQVGGPWTGDVWKAVVSWRKKEDFDVCVVDFDWGCGVLRVRPNTTPLTLELPAILTWGFFESNKTELLNLKTADEFQTWLA